MSSSATPKVLLIIPAFNEQRNIAFAVQTAQRLQAEGAIDGFAVIDDHSSDKTAQFAAKAGALVLPQSVSPTSGKGEAFLTGLLWAKNSGADIIVTLDADLAADFPVKSKQIRDMLLPLIHDGALDMVVYPSVELSGLEAEWRFIECEQTQMEISGQRAIRINALNFLFSKSAGFAFTLSASAPAKRFIQASSGFGLETALNRTIKSYIHLSHELAEPICAQSAHRKAGDDCLQNRQIAKSKNIFKIRHERLQTLLSARKTSFAKV